MADDRNKRADYQQVDARIFDALAELMATMSLDKITVKDIASTAGVSRAAFYAHFEDKYDVAERLELPACRQVVNEYRILIPREAQDDEPLLVEAMGGLLGQRNLPAVVLDEVVIRLKRSYPPPLFLERRYVNFHRP